MEEGGNTPRDQTYRVSHIAGVAPETGRRGHGVCECRHILIYLWGISGVMDRHIHA